MEYYVEHHKTPYLSNTSAVTTSVLAYRSVQWCKATFVLRVGISSVVEQHLGLSQKHYSIAAVYSGVTPLLENLKRLTSAPWSSNTSATVTSILERTHACSARTAALLPFALTSHALPSVGAPTSRLFSDSHSIHSLRITVQRREHSIHSFFETFPQAGSVVNLTPFGYLTSISMSIPQRVVRVIRQFCPPRWHRCHI